MASRKTEETKPPTMAISPPTISLLLLLLLSATIFSLLSQSKSIPDDSESDVAELLTLESQSSSGVIHFNDNLLRRILSSSKAPRTFSLLIFFDAQKLHDKSDLRLKELKSEFSLLSRSFILNNQDSPYLSKLFFGVVEFSESQASFVQFAVNTLPHILLVPPTAVDLKSDCVPMDAGDFSRLADSMAEFVETRTELLVGPIDRPPFLSKTQVSLIVVAFLISLPFLIKKLLAGETFLHSKKFWLAGAVFVYFFSVSGAMHNIIRKMPMFISDRNDPSKLIFFYQGSGMQLGAEGFAVGFLYTIVGLLLAFMTHVLVLVKNRTAQRAVMFVSLVVSFWAVKKVVVLDNWKTGYGIHPYFPSSWQV